MSANDIRNTITMLEKATMEYVANRDFKLVKKVEKDGITYAMGMTTHDYDDNRKVDYDVYKFEREDGFEYNDRFYPQEVYSHAAQLKLSPYVKPNEAHKAFNAWIEQQ